MNPIEPHLLLKDYIIELHTVTLYEGTVKAWFFFGKKEEGKLKAYSWKLKGMWEE